MKDDDWLELDVAIVMETLVSHTPHDLDTPAFRKKLERELRSRHLGSWDMDCREEWCEKSSKTLIKHFKLNPHPHPTY